MTAEVVGLSAGVVLNVANHQLNWVFSCKTCNWAYRSCPVRASQPAAMINCAMDRRFPFKCCGLMGDVCMATYCWRVERSTSHATPPRSCPDESGCMFLYHKPARSAANTGADVVLRAPRLGASEPEMDAWLHSYADALDSVAGAGGPALPMGGPRDQPEPAEDAAAATVRAALWTLHTGWGTTCCSGCMASYL